VVTARSPLEAFAVEAIAELLAVRQSRPGERALAVAMSDGG
jgi:hypothetical protein